LVRGLPLAEAESIVGKYRDELAPEVLAYVRASRKRADLMQLIGWGAAAVFALVAIAAGIAAWVAVDQQAKAEAARTQAQASLERANKALAEGILNDLDMKSDERLTVRQLNALWKLATEGEMVKGDFISALSASPEDMGRVAYRFEEVSRSVRLQWPSPTETRELFFIVLLQLIDKRTDPATFQALAQASQALAAKLTETQLTETQAQQALDAVLQQIGGTTNPRALGVLAQAFQALPAKLTEAQAQQALNPVLQQIGKTTDSNALDALQSLAQALQALAAKLTEAQAQQALPPRPPTCRPLRQADRLPSTNAIPRKAPQECVIIRPYLQALISAPVSNSVRKTPLGRVATLTAEPSRPQIPIVIGTVYYARRILRVVLSDQTDAKAQASFGVSLLRRLGLDTSFKLRTDGAAIDSNAIEF